MTRLVTTALALWGASVWGALGLGSHKVDFDGLRAGSAPPNWVFERARWQVRLDPTAPSRPNVLQLSPDLSPERHPSIALFNPVVCQDGDVTVKFRIGTSSASKTAGIVWRYRDASNYYLLDFSADSKNVALYRIKDGISERVPIPGPRTGVGGFHHELRAGQWYVARVIFRGASISVLLGNRKLFETWDSGLQTAGRTGVSTRNGASASFDDFRIEKRT